MEENYTQFDKHDLDDLVIELDQEQFELINDLNILDEELKNLNGEKLESSFFDSIKEVALKSIDTVFEISDILESNPEQGARITTLNNFKKGITANDEDKSKFDRYDAKTYNSDIYKKDYIKTIKVLDKDSSEFFTDYLTGKRMERGDKVDWDHNTSKKEFDKSAERNFYFNDKEASKTINHIDNLGSTSESINRSKKSEDLKIWEQKKENGSELTNSERFEINKELSDKKYKESKDHLSKETNKKSTSKLISDFKSSAPAQIKSSMGHGAKMAMAKLLKELLKSLIEEFSNKDNASESFASRIKRVFNDVISKIKDVLIVFGKSTLNSFVSELINTIVNFFLTTTKRVFKIIRATFTSIVKAIKIIISKDNKYTFKEKAYEALKVLSAAITLAIGIVLEELIEKAIVNLLPFLAPYASTIAVILASFLTGLATVLILRAWDAYKEKFIFKTEEKIYNAENKKMFAKSELSINSIAKSSVISFKANQNTFLTKKLFEDSLPIFSSLKHQMEETYKNINDLKFNINKQSEETAVVLADTQNLLNQL
jgi:hypothetical protein